MWWENHVLVNGVFKGGGAKGIAYAGALRAADQRGIWFGSVAGASVGAIVASLVAAGLKPAQIESAIPTGLASLSSRKLALVAGFANSLYTNRRLRKWLADCLAEGDQSGRPSDGHRVTFRSLYERIGIGLYVVTLDLETQNPVVFHHLTTPNVSVLEAVVASCAIPGGLPPGRISVDASSGSSIHQLVDGGAWANYPAFVYRDRSFRAWLPPGEGSYGPDEERRPTIGFTLGEATEAPPSVRELIRRSDRIPSDFDLGTSRTSGKPSQYLLSLFLGSRSLRLLLLATVIVLLVATIAGLPGTLRTITAETITWPGALHPLATLLIGGFVLLIQVSVSMLAVTAIVLGRLAADTVVPAAKAALGVATGVPPWAGSDPDDFVVHLDPGGIRTTSFVLPTEVQRDAVEQAAGVCARYIDENAKLRGALGLPDGTQGDGDQRELPDSTARAESTRTSDEASDDGIAWPLAWAGVVMFLGGAVFMAIRERWGFALLGLLLASAFLLGRAYSLL